MSGDDLAELTAFRQRLHRRPETGFDVGCTARLVVERLGDAGMEVTTGVGGSGVVATLRRGTAQRSIGLRADLDALPITERGSAPYASEIDGAHHGCGHDGHSTMLVGAARALARTDGLDGTVQFIFQPAEETGRGAQAMIDDGLFDRFPMDAVFGLHNLPGLPMGYLATRTGVFTTFEDVFTIGVEGSGGHASAPERTVDPLVTGAETVLALQTIVARAVPPADHAVVSVTEFVTDGTRNVIPGKVIIRGDARGYDDHVSATIRTRMEQITAGVAAAHGACAHVEYQREFEPVVNTAAETHAATRAAEQIDGMTVDATADRMSFSEDFAQYLRHRPGCFAVLGNGTDNGHGRPLHHPAYDFNDAAIPYGIDYWCALVRGWLGH